MAGISIAREKCTGCEQCVNACPFGQISIVDDIAMIAEGCTLCGACVEECGAQAIVLQRASVEAVDLAANQGIWVFAEQMDGQVRQVAFELLGEARRLATTLMVPVSAALLGFGCESAAQQLIACGADRVYVLDDPSLAHFNDETHVDVLAQLIEQHKPEIVLIGATTFGRSLAPRVASRLDTGLTADCTLLSIDRETGNLLQTRPAFGGNLMATIVCPNHRPQMATVRPRVMKALAPDPMRAGEIIHPAISVTPPRSTHVLAVDKSLGDSVNLTDAEIIVAAGKGIGSQANMALVHELAHVLCGIVGATRAVVDAGWTSYDHQIGQTGKTVAPKLYIACGISGAVQHLAGISSAEVIVAINKDPDAPIFQSAHYGIVGSVEQVLPALIAELRGITAKKTSIDSR